MPPSIRQVQRRRHVVAGVVAVGVAVGAAPAASADSPTASGGSGTTMPAFYTPPAEIPAQEGTVVRSEPMTYYQDPLHLTELPGTATRMMYTSSDRHGSPMAVTGTVIVPDRAWTGPGERPVIGYAVGTQGLADRCAPSYSGSYGWEYEVPRMTSLLKQGYALAVTDYQGLGTPGPHTYMDREAEGTAVIDSVRAARNLPGAVVPADGPVAFVGYSQGGGASASAAELVHDHAPELDVRGSFVGAAPTDLDALVANLDGGPYSMFAGFTVAGLAENYDIDTDPILNDRGEAYLEQMWDSCTIDLPRHSFRPFSLLTTDGDTAPEVLAQQPFREAVTEQRIGERRPADPVMVYHSRLDEIVPYSLGRDLVRDWRGLGADVQLRTDWTPSHIGSMYAAGPATNRFLDEVFAGGAPGSS